MIRICFLFFLSFFAVEEHLSRAAEDVVERKDSICKQYRALLVKDSLVCETLFFLSFEVEVLICWCSVSCI